MDPHAGGDGSLDVLSVKLFKIQRNYFEFD